MSQVAVNYWENGKREPSIDMLKKIANYFDVSLDELMGKTIYTYTNNNISYVSENQTPYNCSNSKNTSPRFMNCDAQNENDKKQELLDCYDLLNNMGKQEAIKRVSELTEIKRYTKNTP